jgi:3'-phosphoadenosine 5'-phosphosulfate sulfotransferase (PAPS reductase)/FAD synthetase
LKKKSIPESQLLLFQNPPYTLLHLHPKTDFYYVVDEGVEEYVRLEGEPVEVRPYTLGEARAEAERRNTLLGYPIGTYELHVRNSSFPGFRNKLAIPWDIEQSLQNQHADIWYSNSGGKDSDAMTELLELLVRQRDWRGNRRIVHADTGATEWLQTGAYVKRRADELQLPIIVVARPQGDLLTEMYARHQTRPDAPPFPSQQYRWCTGDQKSIQIHKPIRKFTPQGTAVCAIGIRAQESPRRAKQPIWSLRRGAGCSTRLVYDWHPLYFFDEEAVWKALGVSLTELNALRQLTKSARERGEDTIARVLACGWRWHIAYPLGCRRMSCSCCFLAGDEDVRIGAFYNPDAYRAIVALEILSGFSYFPDRWLGTLCPELLTEETRVQLSEVIERRKSA